MFPNCSNRSLWNSFDPEMSPPETVRRVCVRGPWVQGVLRNRCFLLVPETLCVDHYGAERLSWCLDVIPTQRGRASRILVRQTLVRFSAALKRFFVEWVRWGFIDKSVTK